jgi:PadR family transcriptional regulator, regulatory protein PadR
MRGHRHRRHRHRRRSARVERFAEPALLLLLRERPMHGYELIERLPEVAGAETRVDVGNLYRLLRGLEEEGVVTSEWSAELPGPAKRTYELTDEGRALLDRWAESLQEAQGVLSSFLERYGEGR